MWQWMKHGSTTCLKVVVLLVRPGTYWMIQLYDALEKELVGGEFTEDKYLTHFWTCCYIRKWTQHVKTHSLITSLPRKILKENTSILFKTKTFLEAIYNFLTIFPWKSSPSNFAATRHKDLTLSNLMVKLQSQTFQECGVLTSLALVLGPL